jgi:hypothetical protein
MPNNAAATTTTSNTYRNRGDDVGVMGTRQADGSILAQTIQISAGPSARPPGG